jgi:hypothetical protein
MNHYVKIKKENRYVTGVIGTVIRLSLSERIKILFSKGIEVVLTHNCGEDMREES